MNLGFLKRAKTVLKNGASAFRNLAEENVDIYRKTIDQLQDFYTDERIARKADLIEKGKFSAMAEFRETHNIAKKQINEGLEDLSDFDKKEILDKFNETELIRKQAAREQDRSGIFKGEKAKLSESSNAFQVREERLKNYQKQMKDFQEGKSSFYADDVKKLREVKLERQRLKNESKSLDDEINKLLEKEIPDIVPEENPNADIIKEIERKQSIINSPKDSEGRILTKERLRQSHEWIGEDGNTYYKETQSPVYKRKAELDANGKKTFSYDLDENGEKIITGYKSLSKPKYHRKEASGENEIIDKVITEQEYKQAFKERENRLFSEEDLGIAQKVINSADTSGMGFLGWVKENPIPTAITTVVGLKVLDTIFDNDD